MGLKLITGPTTEPVTTAEAKLHLKIETADTADDTLIANLIAAAREWSEQYTRRAFISQTWELGMDEFEEEILLEKTPVSSVTSIKYYDTAGAEQTLATTVYGLSQHEEPNFIYLKYLQIWPTIRGQEDDIKIRFVAGYTTVPASVKAAILLIVGHLYENREDVVVGRQVNDLPKGARYLLDPYRLFTV
jgi:uncharacterized phiE125 gp8 family phage protein